MSALTFDTYEAIKSLTDKGMPEEQAQAITGVIQKAQDAHLEQLSTKADIARLEGRLTLVQWMLAVVIVAEVLPLLKMLFQSGMP